MKKYKAPIIAGWILVALQCLALFGRMASGFEVPDGIAGVFNLLGFFLFGIAGVILLVVGYRRKNAAPVSEEPADPENIEKEKSEK